MPRTELIREQRLRTQDFNEIINSNKLQMKDLTLFQMDPVKLSEKKEIDW